MLNPLIWEGRPLWESIAAEEDWAKYEHFPTFLCAVWEHLGLPDPTEAQLEIAHRLQYGRDSSQPEDEGIVSSRKDIIRAFRGLGKSYITAAFVIWLVMRNPRDEKVLIVSATSDKATQFVSQVKNILSTMPLVKWLLTGEREKGAVRRDMADMFDVRGSSASQAFSVTAKSITGQITGNRATTIVGDDIEIRKNSVTEDARQNIIHAVRSDFMPIVKTEHGVGDIILLGTPQSEESVYNTAVKEIGFTCLTIPSRYPVKEKVDNYVIKTVDGVSVNILAPYLIAKFENGELAENQPTDTRFSEEMLTEYEASGKTAYALQYQLDTSLSDAERYPLKMKDFIIHPTNSIKAPLTISYGTQKDRRNVLNKIPNIGFSGDYMVSPIFCDTEWAAYDTIIAWVDQSGQGADETGIAIGGTLNGYIYILEMTGFKGDSAECMGEIAKLCKKHNVALVIVEANYAGKLWKKAFTPIMRKICGDKCGVKVSDWASGQKELRIIDTLEPALTSHRLVLDEAVATREANPNREQLIYSGIYQLTHITHERGSLKHDDRVDALAGLVGYLQDLLAQDADDAVDEYKKMMEEEELGKYYPEGKDMPTGLYRFDPATGERSPVERF